MNDFCVARKRIKSFQSTDSLDKWRENDAINEVEEMEYTGIFRFPKYNIGNCYKEAGLLTNLYHEYKSGC